MPSSIRRKIAGGVELFAKTAARLRTVMVFYHFRLLFSGTTLIPQASLGFLGRG